MVCKMCNTEIPQGASFCPMCGTKIEAVSSEVTAPEVVVPEVVTPEIATPEVEAPMVAPWVSEEDVKDTMSMLFPENKPEPPAVTSEAAPAGDAVNQQATASPAPEVVPVPTPAKQSTTSYEDVYGNTGNYSYSAPLPEPSLILTLGILGVVFSGSGVIGIILSAICLSKEKGYHTLNGPSNSMVSAGKVLGIIGLIFSILVAVGIALYALFWIVFAITAGGLAAYFL